MSSIQDPPSTPAITESAVAEPFPKQSTTIDSGAAMLIEKESSEDVIVKKLSSNNGEEATKLEDTDSLLTKESKGRWMTITFVRHGQCESNAKDTWLNAESDLLTERGRAQAQALGKQFADVRIDALYTSPLARAMDTAKEIADNHNTPLEIKSLSLVEERNHGSQVDRLMRMGRSDEAWRERTGWTGYDGKFSRSHRPGGGGESMEDVAQRAFETLCLLSTFEGRPLKFEPPECRIETGSESTNDLVPNDVPHIVVVSHNLFLCEMFELFASWDKPEHVDRRNEYANTEWSRHLINMEPMPRENLPEWTPAWKHRTRMSVTHIREPALPDPWGR